MPSAAVVKKTVLQGGAHAENVACLALLCAENAVVQAVATHSYQFLLMAMTNLTGRLIEYGDNDLLVTTVNDHYSIHCHILYTVKGYENKIVIFDQSSRL